MIRTALRLVALGAGLVIVAACGGDDESSPYPSADSFCAAKAAEECKAVAAACAVSSEACKSARVDACNAAAGAATTQGRIYRAANAENCIAQTRAVYAERVIVPEKQKAYIEACDRVFTGNKKQFEACVSTFDCEGTLTCDLDKKVCAQKVERNLNDGCSNAGETCGKGLYCQARGTIKVCTPKNARGETCSASDAPCMEDLRCNGTTCVALEEQGQPCDTNDECTTGFCNVDKKCQARQYASETGTCKDFGGK